MPVVDEGDYEYPEEFAARIPLLDRYSVVSTAIDPMRRQSD
jgi:hypothetical protein